MKAVKEWIVIVFMIAIVGSVVGLAIQKSNELNQPKPVFVPKAQSERIAGLLGNGLHRVYYEGKVYLIYVAGGSGVAIIEHKADLDR